MTNTESLSRPVRTFGTGARLNVAKADLRELLETNLVALHALLEEHQRVLDVTVRAIAGLRADVRMLTDARAPWVKALADTRALLYVALHEVVAGNEPLDKRSEVEGGYDPLAIDTLAFARVE